MLIWYININNNKTLGIHRCKQSTNKAHTESKTDSDCITLPQCLHQVFVCLFFVCLFLFVCLVCLCVCGGGVFYLSIFLLLLFYNCCFLLLFFWVFYCFVVIVIVVFAILRFEHMLLVQVLYFGEVVSFLCVCVFVLFCFF